MEKQNNSEIYITSPFVSSGDKFNITIKGKITQTDEGPKLEIIPGFVLRIDWENESARSIRFLQISLEEPEKSLKPIQDKKIDYSSVTGFDITLTSGIPVSDIAGKKKIKLPVEMYLNFLIGGETVSFGPIKAFINSNAKAEKTFMANYHDMIFSTTPMSGPLFFIGMSCIHIWWITGGIFWTKCLGGCLPFVTNCKCLSPVSGQLRAFCGWWVPCFCVPWFM